MVEYYVLHTKCTIFTNAQCVPQQTHCVRSHHSITTLLKALLSLCYTWNQTHESVFSNGLVPIVGGEQLQNEALWIHLILFVTLYAAQCNSHRNHLPTLSMSTHFKYIGNNFHIWPFTHVKFPFNITFNATLTLQCCYFYLTNKSHDTLC